MKQGIRIFHVGYLDIRSYTDYCSMSQQSKSQRVLHSRVPSRMEIGLRALSDSKRS